jgi:puromycin-sensitive aminopeptidase
VTGDLVDSTLPTSRKATPALPKEVNSKFFRLSNDVRPVHYVPKLSIDWKTEKFTGHQTVDLKLAKPQQSITLHAKDLRVSNVSVRVGNQVIRPVAIKTSKRSDTVTFLFDKPLPQGDAQIAMDWTGQMNNAHSTDENHRILRGLYKTGPMAITQFEASEARRLFPTFDEPDFKATWKLSLDIPKELKGYNNQEKSSQHVVGDRRHIVFKETQPITSYLSALVIGDLVAPHYTKTKNGTLIRTLATPDKAGLTGFSLPYAKSAIEFYEEYFQQPYAFGKMDLVGVPDFEVGAMENIGLVTFRETDLLIDPEVASLAQKIREVEVVDHELAHQWNGNMVSPKWWDDLWLNESFATFMAAKAEEHQEPDWHIDGEFNAGKETAMGLDSMVATHPIRAKIRNAEDANQAFDVITYEKGASVLRMLEGYIGEDVFRDGMRSYIKAHKFGNAVAEDLWNELEAASKRNAEKTGADPVPVRDLVHRWVGQKGFPLVGVERQGNTVSLKQNRFFAEAGHTDQRLWPIPVVLRYEDSRGVHEQRVLLNKRDQKVKLDAVGEVKWVDANGGARGYYRVGYSANELDALAKNLPALSAQERVELISDEYAQMKAGARTMPQFLSFLTRFQGERDNAVIEELVARLSIISNNFLDKKDEPQFRAMVRRMFQPAFQEVGWDAAPGEKQDVMLRRLELITALGVVGRDPAIAAEASARVQRMLAGDKSALPPDLQGPAASIAARTGDAKLFDTYLNYSKSTSNPHERVRYTTLLASFEDPALAKRATDMAFNDSIRSQDRSSFFAYLMRNPSAREQTWKRMQSDWTSVEKNAGGPALLQHIIQTIGLLPGRESLEQVQAFFKKQQIKDADRVTTQTVERMKQAVALQERFDGQVHQWMTQTGAAAA